MKSRRKVVSAGSLEHVGGSRNFPFQFTGGNF